jgi:cell division protease FtsH
MNEPNNRKNLPQPGGPPERFHPKMLIFCLVIMLLLIGIWAASSSPQMGHISEMSVNQVLQAVDNKQIENLTLRADPGSGVDWYSVTGQRKNPLYNPKEDQNAPGAQPEFLAFEANGRLTPDHYDKLAAYPNAEEKGSNTLLTTLLVDMLFPLALLLLIYFLLMRQFKLAGRGAMAFGKSRARMLTRDREKVTFKEVAGCDEAKEEVAEIVEFLKDPKKFQRIGGRVPARRTCRFSAFRDRTSWRCSWVWARRGCATCSSRGARTRRASFS